MRCGSEAFGCLPGTGTSSGHGSRYSLSCRCCVFWVIVTLGERWTTRIIVVPGTRLVRSGPYRAIKHLNCLVVAAEIAVLPLAFGLPLLALVFTVLNAAVLLVRVRAEDRALDPR